MKAEPSFISTLALLKVHDYLSLQIVLVLIHFHTIFSAQGQHLLGKVFLPKADYDLDLFTYFSVLSIFKTIGSLV